VEEEGGEVMAVNIHQGCSLEAMKSMKDNQYDLAVVDPPYGIGITGDMEMSDWSSNDWTSAKSKEYTQKEWDTQAPPLEYFQEVCRVSRNQIVWGGQYFTDKLPVSGGWIVWDKGVSMPTLGKAELAWTSMKNSVDMVRLLWAGYRKCEVTDRIHPWPYTIGYMKSMPVLE
jgi:site-specific DNA-methyltransferase (adenine-specific)